MDKRKNGSGPRRVKSVLREVAKIKIGNDYEAKLAKAIGCKSRKMQELFVDPLPSITLKEVLSMAKAMRLPNDEVINLVKIQSKNRLEYLKQKQIEQ